MHLSESIRLELCENSKVLGLRNNGLEKENNEFREQLIAAKDKCKELKGHVKVLSEKNSTLAEIEKEHQNLALLCNKLQNDIHKSEETVKTVSILNNYFFQLTNIKFLMLKILLYKIILVMKFFFIFLIYSLKYTIFYFNRWNKHMPMKCCTKIK